MHSMSPTYVPATKRKHTQDHRHTRIHSPVGPAGNSPRPPRAGTAGGTPNSSLRTHAKRSGPPRPSRCTSARPVWPHILAQHVRRGRQGRTRGLRNGERRAPTPAPNSENQAATGPPQAQHTRANSGSSRPHPATRHAAECRHSCGRACRRTKKSGLPHPGRGTSARPVQLQITSWPNTHAGDGRDALIGRGRENSGLPHPHPTAKVMQSPAHRSIVQSAQWAPTPSPSGPSYIGNAKTDEQACSQSKMGSRTQAIAHRQSHRSTRTQGMAGKHPLAGENSCLPHPHPTAKTEWPHSHRFSMPSEQWAPTP